MSSLTISGTPLVPEGLEPAIAPREHAGAPRVDRTPGELPGIRRWNVDTVWSRGKYLVYYVKRENGHAQLLKPSEFQDLVQTGLKPQ